MVSHSPDPPFEHLQFFAQRHQPKRMPIAHWHSQIELNFLCRGRMTYLINGRWVPLPQRRLGVFWGAVPHQVVRQENESDLVVIYLPLGEFLKQKLPDRIRQRLMGGGFLADRTEDRADAILLPRWHDDLLSGRDDLKELVRQEIACRLRRLALTGYSILRGADVAAMPDNSGTDHSFERVRLMTVTIAERFATALTVDEIARTADIHPNYAMTLFRRTIGMTVAEYLTRQRLSHAQSMLIDTNLPVATIARRSGFGSQSRFYEVFRQWTGTSPKHYRSDLMNAAEPVSPIRQ